MPLTPGTRLGPYAVQSLLGTGGMGEVYRARDTKLNRDVAIKVLPDVFASDPERLVRFDREAQLLASLNHPHIAQVYGLEDSAPAGSGEAVMRALVMELVDGPTLADRIRVGAIPLEEALTLARQIAEALEAAHERGIIHRDLKPANIKLTAGGAVKVLDFGLAKALDPLNSGNVERAFSPAAMNSPTFISPATQLGVILGTAAYMAPEQARGKAVDKRADIWAFGVVLYEMLAGRRPFNAETGTDSIAALLLQEIDWTPLPADTPDDLRRLLRRCLERDPKNRLHDAADARLVIADLQREGSAATVARRVSRTRRPWLLVGTVATATAIVGALLGRGLFMGPPRAEPVGAVVRFAIEPPPEVTNVTSVTVAADGRFIVYEGVVEGQSRLFVRRVDRLESRPLAGTEGARGPFVSPDGAWIGFFRDGRMYKVSADGGDVLAVSEERGGPGATWDGNDRIIFSRTVSLGTCRCVRGRWDADGAHES